MHFTLKMGSDIHDYKIRGGIFVSVSVHREYGDTAIHASRPRG
jgi:hypothetical protein